PRDVAVDSSGNVWVADQQNGRVQEFNSAGVFLNQIGVGQLAEPYGLSIDSSGNVWVADLFGGSISEFNTAGALLVQFAVSEPTGIAVDAAGHVWVSDINHERILEFALVPEPASIVSWAIGAAALAFVARRNRRRVD